MFTKLGFLVVMVIALVFSFNASAPVGTVNADHGDPVVVGGVTEGAVYAQFEVVGWGIVCHVGYTCTRDQVPGGLDGFHLNTSVPCTCFFIATATEITTGDVFTVQVKFYVSEPAECEGEVAPVIITLEPDGTVESAPDCAVAAPDDGEGDVPVWTGWLY